MKSRHFVIATLILATIWQSAVAQPKKKSIQVETPPVEGVLIGTNDQSDAVVADLAAVKPQMPLGPEDLLKSYEIAMSLLAQRTSTDFSTIVQAEQTDQISREQAEYLLQQRYQTAMMQYQVLGALHDVLKHDIDEATQEVQSSLKTTRADTVVMVPFPGSNPESR